MRLIVSVFASTRVLFSMHRIVIVTLWVLALGFDAGIAQEQTLATKEKEDPSTSDASGESESADPNDPLREMQSLAIKEQKASWGHWGNQPDL